VLQLQNQNLLFVTSAYKLSKKEEDEIIKDLSDKYKTTVSIDIEIDENLVGGVVIKEGDKVQTPFLVYLTLCLALR
jgi:F-type H+-transporting ATPase subunit delta